MIRRESSEFLRQKQRQWEQEKAESESRPEWFPFGENLTPGGGSPLRKHHNKVVESCEMQEESTSCSTTMPAEHNSPDKMNENPQKPQAPPTYPYPMYPTYTLPYHQFYHNPHNPHFLNHTTTVTEEQHNEHTAHHHQPPQFFAPQYQVIPAGAIPVSTINIDPSQICPVDQMGMWAMPPPSGPNGMRYGIPIPAPFVPQIMTTSTSSSSNAAILNAMMMTSSSVANHHNDSSSESGVSGVKDDEKSENKEEEERREERQSTSDYTDDDPIPLTRRSATGTATCNYEEQMEEKKRFAQEEESRERMEMLEIERQRRILEDRRSSEEQQRLEAERKRYEEDRRRAEQFEQAMEKARKEAELLKKAKLYKHVLRGAEEEGGDEQLEELEQKILGVDIQTGRRLLKEVHEVEWHKKQDQVEIRKKAPPPDKDKDRSIVNGTPRGRSMSISQNSPTPFARNTFGRRSVRTTSREKHEQQRPAEQFAHCPQLSPIVPSPFQPSHHHHHHHQDPSHHHHQNRPEEPPHQLETRESARPPNTRPTCSSAEQRVSERRTEEMLHSSPYYHRLDRGPLSQQEQARIGGHKPTSPPSGPHVRQNESSIGLFSQIATRSSCRRAPPQMRAPTTTIHQRRADSFEEGSSSSEEAAGSISPDLAHKDFSESPLPSSTENMHPAPESPKKNEKSFEYTTSLQSPPRNRSALGASNESTPRRPSSRMSLQKTLESKGQITKVDDRNLSEDIRHVATVSMSRAGSLADLRGSFQNLSVRGSHLNLASSGEPSPNLSRFASVNSPARQSLTSIRKTTERQTAVLERLGRLRESLHAGKNYAPPRGNAHSYSTASSRVHTPAPPISP